MLICCPALKEIFHGHNTDPTPNSFVTILEMWPLSEVIVIAESSLQEWGLPVATILGT